MTKPPYNPTRMEQETILTTSVGTSELATTIRRAADEKIWHLFSEIPSHVRRFKLLFGDGKLVRNGGGYRWEVPFDQLAIIKRKKMPLSQAQRAALSARAKATFHQK